MARPILTYENLRTYYRILRGYVRAVDDVSFQMNEGEALGLAGESGCGKTTLALATLKILPPGGFIAGGRILFRDIDITKMEP
jgi:peptide/nickel transport system ATP-binding protein